MLHLLSSVEIRTGDLLLGRPVCASQLANKSFKVTVNNSRGANSIAMGCFNRAEAGERQNAEAEAVEDLETIAAQFVLGCWSKSRK